MSWKAHEAAERIADGWYSELEYTRKRNAVLGRENAKLREDMEDLEGYNQKLRDMLWQVTELKVKAGFENAKLRELVRDMYEMAYPEYPSAFATAFADRMRELRVEVD